MNGKTWTEEEKVLLSQLFPHMGVKEISVIMNRTIASVNNTSYSLKLKKDKSYKQHKKIYHSLNHDYFHDIDRPDKAYWLGWLWADGNVHEDKKRNSYVIKLKLNEADEYIIQKFKDCISATCPIRKTTQNACQIQITSSAMFHDLVSHGVIPNKSYHGTEPSNLPNEFLSHFVRGAFDGDGSIYINPTIYKKNFSIVGTKAFCQWLHKSINTILDINGGIGPSHKNEITYRFSVQSAKNIKIMAEWMYQDCGEFKLERKYNRFVENGLL